MRDRLRYRSPELVAAILDAFHAEQEISTGDPVPWREVIAAFESEKHTAKTVEETVRDLVSFGALHRVGQPATRDRLDSRALFLTTLGAAWLEQTLLPLPRRTSDQ